MVLDGLEALLNETLARARAERYANKVYLIRYADDFIITATRKALLEEGVKPLLVGFLAERGLELSEKKTRVTHIEEGVDFLGFHLRKYKDGKLIITPSKKSVKQILTKIRTLIKKHRTVSAETLINLLNPVIRGWANFFRHVVSKKMFATIDHETWKSLWQWARRRHRKKSGKWLRKKYFTTERGLWGFVDTKTGKTLLKMSSIPIRRHIKIRSEVNPYDPQWELYLEQRQQQRAKWILWSKERYTLWKRQDGKCPWCGDDLRVDIEPDGTSHVHHVVYTSQGGSDALKNKQLLHDVCHRQLHVLRDSKRGIAGHVEDMAYDGLSCVR